MRSREAGIGILVISWPVNLMRGDLLILHGVAICTTCEGQRGFEDNMSEACRKRSLIMMY